MRDLLDTNIFIAAMKGVEGVRHKLEHTPASDLVLSPVVLGELEFGVEKSAYREKTLPVWRTWYANSIWRHWMPGLAAMTRLSAPIWSGRACRSARMISGSPPRDSLWVWWSLRIMPMNLTASRVWSPKTGLTRLEPGRATVQLPETFCARRSGGQDALSVKERP